MKLTVITPDGRTLSRDDVSVWEILARINYLQAEQPEAIWSVEP